MAAPAPVTIDPRTIPKFVNQLVVPPVYTPTIVTDPNTGSVVRHDYSISMNQFEQQILPPGFPMTTVWGYAGMVQTPAGPAFFQNAPGATFEATRGIPVQVTWTNNITGPHLLPVDPTLHWANPNMMPMNPPMPWPAFPPGFPQAQSPVPLVPHLHGGEQQSFFDGHPDAWWTFDGKTGPAYSTNVYNYPNKQNPTTLWYHDHALGITRLNVLMGLAGFYLLRDPANPLDGPNSPLPKGKYEIPIVIQDRDFYANGSFFFPTAGINPTIHPYWNPEFFGNVIMVNGKVWPNLNVDRATYRFRLLNGSSARFYDLNFSNKMPFTVIGSDGGYLPKAATVTSLLIAPGERYDILVDFSGIAPGTMITLENHAKAPFPHGAPADPQTTGQIMQFTVPVTAPAPVPPPVLPPTLNTITVLTPNKPKRTLTLFEIAGPAGPVMVTLNGQKWAAPISELPQVGSTEEWEIVNLTMDAHPIHLHLVQFQVVSRQPFQAKAYTKDWLALNAGLGAPPWMTTPQSLAVAPYLQGAAAPPPPEEAGWKDTFKALPGEVTIVKARWAPQDAPATVTPGTNAYSFDPTAGPGYVWHCHILDHEDNEMMRPYKVTP